MRDVTDVTPYQSAAELPPAEDPYAEVRFNNAVEATEDALRDIVANAWKQAKEQAVDSYFENWTEQEVCEAIPALDRLRRLKEELE